MFKARKARKAVKAAQAAVTERRNRWELFNAYGVSPSQNPYNPA